MTKLFRCLFFFFSFFLEVHVEAEQFTKTAIEKSLVAEIMQKVSFSEFDVSLDTWQSAWANTKENKVLNIIELDMSPDQKRFKAVVSWGEGTTKKVSGKIKKFITVPVLSTPIAHQSPINESHLSYVQFSEDLINQGMALRKEDLVGKTLKSGRSLNLNKPLLMSDIEVPVVIKKGEQVRIKYVSPHFEISVVGVAKSNGCIGERISFDAAAKKIIQATVLHSGVAEIREQL